MIMHYLGLDHIGHKAGPLSPNMVPKQREMDGIVRQIYEGMTTMSHLKNTLFILCGDHGMNDGGNHGGSAPGETSPALVFMSPKFRLLSNGLPCPTEPKQEFEYYNMVEQSDVAPTIAGLLGVPVPQNNLGVFIKEFLPLWTTSEFITTCVATRLWLMHERQRTKQYFVTECKADTQDCGSYLHGCHLHCRRNFS